MKPTGLRFKWDKDSKEDNAITAFKEHNINWEYDQFHNLTADFNGSGLFEKIDYIPHGDEVFEIMIK